MHNGDRLNWCRGPEACGLACTKQEGCTAFDVRPDGTGCLLYGHARVAPASGVPGDCYYPPPAIQGGAPSADSASGGKRKKYKIPEFEAPAVEPEEDVVSDDDEWLFEPPPPVVRSGHYFSCNNFSP